jgi:hypothetical protein
VTWRRLAAPGFVPLHCVTELPSTLTGPEPTSHHVDVIVCKFRFACDTHKIILMTVPLASIANSGLPESGEIERFL